MDSAELYMMLIRPSMIPIIGEAWTIPFNLQIELATWGWTLSNSDELRNASKREGAFSKHKTELQTTANAKTAQSLQLDLARLEAELDFDDIDAQIEKQRKIINNPRTSDADRKTASTRRDQLEEQRKDKTGTIEKQVGDFKSELQRKARGEKSEAELRAQERERRTSDLQGQIEEAQKEKFKFRFSKRVDFASTQMLNSMKQGDLFPTGIITLFQRAPNLNHAASLIITVSKFRLLEYKLRCEVSDTMTDMREDWTAEFFSLSYVYKGRGMIKKESGAALVTAAVTQGTPRVFSMSMEGTLPI
jgi:type VI protein secretion system component Hcp